MAGKTCSDDEFVRLFQTYGATETARQLGCMERAVYKRRANLARFDPITAPTKQAINFPGRLPLEIRNGTALIGSDFHIWPGEPSTCLRAFKKFVADIKPSAVILNGDVMDFPRISRHPQNWEKAPDPQEEIESVQDHLNDIVQACKRGAHKVWTLGNHDARWEATFANAVPQMRGVKGVHLADHFSGVWQKAMSCFINEGVPGGATMVKHRWKGGMNATRANALNAGVSMITGHLHSQNVRPLSDYNRFDRYGVDTGCVADKEHRAFSYTEDSALDWRSGFALLTYRDGILMPPELITKMDAKTVWFRGQLHKV
ncbi:UDP-2,3-diacylglucosamine pyrophosphatase LpxH [Bradyrhizobium sp. AZCC 1578]|uniref:metallophosphoesterase n=1 Tax=Bradyrhizobium sp. AZCC 1578 TaxID=3117027 RepID=UPI002FF41B63